jgi:HD-GYP domain-containing protein (c-di-GMP phosphodiesterase class II)
MIPIVRHHHERWDGSGYPDGLSREDIPAIARVVAIGDAFDAMTSDRPYRRALSSADAFEEIERGSGRHFDPVCVDAFLNLRPRLEKLVPRKK